jgi:hypothetical protein
MSFRRVVCRTNKISKRRKDNFKMRDLKFEIEEPQSHNGTKGHEDIYGLIGQINYRH